MTGLISAATLYKKQNGTLSIANNRKSIQWVPSGPGPVQALEIATADIANFQQSPASSAKASVKFLVHQPGTTGQVEHVMRFTSPVSAKQDKEAFIAILSEVISALKKAAAQTTSQAVHGSSVSTPQATGMNAASEQDADTFSDATYLSDTALQRSLLKQDEILARKFQESVNELKNNPKTSFDQFNKQFWSSRIHLLRSHAVERSQVQGPYNVLSQIKKTQNNEGVVQLNLSKEQIALIFQQHPVTRKIYNNLVPTRLSESAFWSKFFASRLFKKLKGEKITDQDPTVAELDKYLDEDESLSQATQFNIDKIPRFLDLDGNEQDHTETMGNAPDETMRPSRHDRVPILRALNAMSEKMMANVAPSDAENLFDPAGADESKFEQLQLRDLQTQDDDNRVRLNVSAQQKFFSQDTPGNGVQAAISDPASLISDLRSQLSTDSSLVINMDERAKSKAVVATSNILKTISQRKTGLTTHESKTGVLPAQFIQSATMTHNTTIEFLHYFWSVYLSGDESRAGELANLAETLDKSLERMEAVAKDADAEREHKLQQLREKQKQYEQATGKKARINMKNAGAGGDAVRDMLAATEKAVRYAEAEYQKSYTEQMAQAQQAQNGAT
jgi:transcription initiation factor TFIIH subunit 1